MELRSVSSIAAARPAMAVATAEPAAVPNTASLPDAARTREPDRTSGAANAVSSDRMASDRTASDSTAQPDKAVQTDKGFVPGGLISPVLRYDQTARVAVIYYRDADTGKTTVQIPTQQVVEEYRRNAMRLGSTGTHPASSGKTGTDGGGDTPTTPTTPARPGAATDPGAGTNLVAGVRPGAGSAPTNAVPGTSDAAVGSPIATQGAATLGPTAPPAPARGVGALVSVTV